MPKKQYKKNQEELRRIYDRHQSIWSRAAGLLGSWLSREPTAVNVTDQANEEEEKERQSVAENGHRTYAYLHYIAEADTVHLRWTFNIYRAYSLQPAPAACACILILLIKL